MLEGLSPEARNWIDALLILASFWVPALALRLLWRQILTPWISKSRHADLQVIIKPVRGLIIWTLVLAGANYALQGLDYVQNNPSAGNWIEKAISAVWIVISALQLVRLTNGAYYLRARAEAGEAEIKDRVSTAQKLTTGIIFVLGALFILRVGGIDISPLLAGGAIGGIIIGLALQDSLSNVFAGFFLNMDRPIQVGDLLRLDQDREGFVEEVGWRYTKVRLWNDSLLMIPNNKFGQSSFINFNRPVSEVTVNVDCSVTYDSDLDLVEKVAIEAAKAAQKAVNEREMSYEPAVRWRAFGNSAIEFRVFCRADHATKQYLLLSTCIKEIKARFNEAGITIPFPIMVLQKTQSDYFAESPKG